MYLIHFWLSAHYILLRWHIMYLQGFTGTWRRLLGHIWTLSRRKWPGARSEEWTGNCCSYSQCSTGRNTWLECGDYCTLYSVLCPTVVNPIYSVYCKGVRVAQLVKCMTFNPRVQVFPVLVLGKSCQQVSSLTLLAKCLQLWMCSSTLP